MSGIWFLGAVLPVLPVLLVVIWGVYRFIMRDAITLEGFMEDFPPEIPTKTQEPEYRFVPSTIVRPPNVMSRKDEDEDDDNGKS